MKSTRYLLAIFMFVTILISLISCSSETPAPVTIPVPAHNVTITVPVPAPTQTGIPTHTVTSSAPPPAITYTPPALTDKNDEEWAKIQVTQYLVSLAESAAAIRYVADLIDGGWFEAKYDDYNLGVEISGHKNSGWTVYYRPYDSHNLKHEYWGNLGWIVCQDNYVTEGNDEALRLRADLVDLNR